MAGPALDPNDFKQAMSRFGAGVTVVTTRDSGGRPWGFTASAFSSLSLAPPLILVCLDRNAESFPAFETADALAVSILGAGQSAIAMRFATRGADKFGSGDMVDGPRTGMPVVAGALARVECTMYARLDGGDHVILVAQVLAAEVTDGQPLIHYNRAFGRFVAEG